MTGPPMGDVGVICPIAGELPMAGRTPGGVPCLDRWNAFIFACISCGSPPPPRPVDIEGGFRASVTMPSGRDEAVMMLRPCGSVEARSEGGILGGCAASCEGAEGSCESGNLRAKSFASPGGPV